MPWSDITLVSNPRGIDHYMPFPRPHLEAFERPLRVEMILHHLKRVGILNKTHLEQPIQVDMETVRLVHSPYLIDTTMIMSELGSGELGEAAFASPELLRSALQAVGGAVKAAELVIEGETKHAFSIMRPPGHHATTSTPMGLCYFNNIAIAIRYVQQMKGIARVSILDFDDHFGNGTAEIFYADKDVQYISIHEYDYENYGIGHFSELGYGAGRGTNINIPLLENSPDESYIKAIENIVVPAIERHEPEIIAVSAGFDAHYADPVGNMDIDSSTFWFLGNIVRLLVKKTGARGSFWVLEGGYNLALLGQLVETTLTGLAGGTLPKLNDQIERQHHSQLVETNERVIEEIIDVVCQHSSNGNVR